MESCCLKPLRFSKVVCCGAKTNQQMELLKTIKLNQNQNGHTHASAKLNFKVPFFLSSANLPPPFLDRHFRNWVQP